jgi:Tfp pilus assembly protein PilV
VRSKDPDKRPRRFRLRAERGSMLVEVMVGAIVLAIAATAILNGIDGAQSAGAKNKAKSVQSSLAQQDIERMRALPVSRLDGLNETNYKNVGGVDYTVVSTTAWVSDKAGAVNCSATGAQADYLKLRSSVTSPATGTAPVVETGLLTPSVGQSSTTTGTATVQVLDRNNVAIGSGQAVALSGASTQSATTNSAGCAVFGSIPIGTYTISVTGRVSLDSSPATDSMQVYPGRGTFVPMQAELPATARASFARPTGQTIGLATATWDKITVENGNLPGFTKVFTGTKAATLDAGGLFPYLDGVNVWAGDCASNDPSSYAGQTNYFQVGRGFTSLTPSTTSTVTVQMPALRVPATNAAGGSWGLRATLVPVTGDNCGTAVTATYGRDTAVSGTHNADFIVPFGTYRVCVDNGARYQVFSSVALTLAPPAANKTITALSIPASSNFGTCPK